MKQVIPAIWRTLTLVLAGACALAASPIRESFESPEASWELGPSDCGPQVLLHRRVFDASHTGTGSEFLQFNCRYQGTEFLLTHSVAPARVIDELAPSLWVKSTSPGIHFLARLVLPRTEHPETGEPLTAKVSGGIYSAAGSWQQLRISDLRRQLAEQVIVLRKAFPQCRVDDGEAYIDMLMLNVYTGRGMTELWIDDLELQGFASATPSGKASVLNSGARPLAEPGIRHRPPVEIQVQRSILNVSGRPYFARVVEHNGEPFSFLKGLGFNTIKLRQPPTPIELDEAERLQVWLLAPPSHDPTAGSGSVLAWLLGEQLTHWEAPTIGRRAAELRGLMPELSRPLVCDVESSMDRFAGIADILVVGRRSLGTSFALEDLDRWVADQRRASGRDLPCWVSIQTEPLRAVQDQIVTLSGEDSRAGGVEPEQVWLQAWHAVAAGARGLCFRSRSRLDAPDPGNRLRAATLRTLNHELEIIEPWVAAGQNVAGVWTSDPRVRVSVLQSARSRLLLAVRIAADQQFSVGPVEQQKPLLLALPGVPPTHQAYRTSGEGLQPLHREVNQGFEIRLDRLGMIATVVLTPDPLVVNHLGRSVARQRRGIAQGLMEVAQLHFEETERIARRLMELDRTLPDTQRRLQTAEQLLQQGQQLLHTGDTASAQRYARQVLSQLRGLRHGHWHQALIDLPAPVSSPLCTNFQSLPAHWELAHRLQANHWDDNLLQGGDFENPQGWFQTGWVRQGGGMDGIETAVRFTSDTPHSGRWALSLEAWSRASAKARFAMPWPLLLTTPPLVVRQGELIRIDGWVHVPRPVAGSRDGVLIFDSMSGLDLAQRVDQTPGWQRFTLYRAAPSSGEFTVAFTLTGLGEVRLDDVSITRLAPQPE